MHKVPSKWRPFLGLAIALATTLMAALARNVPPPFSVLWGEPRPQSKGRGVQNGSVIRFDEVAQQAGVTAPNVWGGISQKRFILETKGNGVAFFDFDNDGWLDIYLTNGTRFER